MTETRQDQAHERGLAWSLPALGRFRPFADILPEQRQLFLVMSFDEGDKVG
jgi:hypothetical protein